MNALGQHLLLELKGCPVELLKDRDFVEQALVETARRAKTHIVSQSFHTFNPHGVSGAVVIAESHISIHTWPEYGYAALDIFTCGDNALPYEGTEHLIEVFKPEEHQLIEVRRGIFDSAQSLQPPRLINREEPDREDYPAVVSIVAH